MKLLMHTKNHDQTLNNVMLISRKLFLKKVIVTFLLNLQWAEKAKNEYKCYKCHTN